MLVQKEKNIKSFQIRNKLDNIKSIKKYKDFGIFSNI